MLQLGKFTTVVLIRNLCPFLAVVSGRSIVDADDVTSFMGNLCLRYLCDVIVFSPRRYDASLITFVTLFCRSFFCTIFINFG